MLDAPLLSIVIATYNCSSTLQKCLDSIYSQSWSAIEIVIIDGASKDATVAIIKQNADHLAYWTSEADSGIYDAWNKALIHAKGDWIYFLGADDVLHAPTSIENAMRALTCLSEETLVAYGCIHYIERDGSSRVIGAPWEVAGPKMPTQMSLPHQAVFHARGLFTRFGRFDSNFQIAGDYKMIMQSMKIAAPVYLGNMIIADQRAGGKSSLRKNRAATLREFRKVQIDLGYPMSVSWMLIYIKGLMWSTLSRIRSFD